MEETMQKTPQAQPKGRGGTLWAVLIIIVLIVGGYILYQGNQDDFGFVQGDILRAQVAGNADEVVLEEVYIPEGGGFVVVYEENTDGTRTAVGQSRFLPAGKHTNVVVPISSEAKRKLTRRGTNERAAKYLAVAHQDSNEDGAFDLTEDEPFVDESGEELSAEIEIGDEEAPEESDPSEDVSDNTDETSDEPGEGQAEEVETPDTNVITYTENGFEPSELTISVGNTVTWVNESSLAMWPASAMHPTHTVYPDSDIEKCGTAEEENIFDSCSNVETYSFTFNEVGEWGFHNHSNVSHFGKIIVE